MDSERSDTRDKFIVLVILGIILPFAIQSIPYNTWSLIFPFTSPFAFVYSVAVISSAVAFVYYVIKYIKIDRRFAAAPILLLIVSTGVILWSVPLSRNVFSSSDTEPPLYPVYLSGSFTVTEAETGIQDPILEVAVDLDRGDNYTPEFVIQFLLLNYTLEQLEHISDIASLIDDEQMCGYYWFVVDPATMDFPLANMPCTYVWILWLQASSIPESWAIDISLTLKFSIL
ncbi:MAG: hypothetical protein ACFFD3_16545 [Candidatus Thorarchaeota archaeon]